MLEEKQGRPGTEASENGTVDCMQLGTYSVEYRGVTAMDSVVTAVIACQNFDQLLSMV